MKQQIVLVQRPRSELDDDLCFLAEDQRPTWSYVFMERDRSAISVKKDEIDAGTHAHRVNRVTAIEPQAFVRANLATNDQTERPLQEGCGPLDSRRDDLPGCCVT